MDYYKKNVECLTQIRNKPFRVLLFPISETSNKIFREQAYELALSQGGISFNPAGDQRNAEVILKTRYLGALSEIVLLAYLQQALGDQYIVSREEYQEYETHVDIKVASKQKVVTIEVRGSFLYSPLDRVICSLFDMLGPYSTSYKPGETIKEFYLRTLINVRIDKFDIFEDHGLIFAGGAERSLFAEIGYTTDFKQQGATCLAIKPIARARDSAEIVEKSRRGCGRKIADQLIG